MNKIITKLSIIIIMAVVILGITNHYNDSIISLEDFTKTVINGDSTMVVGVYQDSEFALKVIQQPEGDFIYLPDTEDTIVQLAQAELIYGNIGLGAHRYLSGKYIASLEPGEIVKIVYGDGSFENIVITDVNSYQAISPDDLYSDFRDLEDDHIFTSTELFEKAFGGNSHVSFITCISKEDVNSWGRIVVSSAPAD